MSNIGREILPFLCKRKNMVGVEIGVDHAKYSKYLLKTGLFDFFYCVDDWNATFYDVLDDSGNPLKLLFSSDLIYKSAKNNLSDFDNVSVIRKTSKDAVLQFEDSYFDFIYIDSNHLYDNVLDDIKLWWPKLKLGGLLCGDDYINGYNEIEYENIKYKAIIEVKAAVDNFCSMIDLKVNTIYPSDRYPNWYIIK
jgi:hypothetical protein